MAEKTSYPQLPSTVWWGLRSILQKTPNATIDERHLGIQLGVQEAAARQYVSELKRVGILTEESKATQLAQRWRHDETYSAAVREIIKNTYPESLVELAPPEEADRQKIVSWFTREGLGTGSASNKAATYLLIGSPSPTEAPSRASSTDRAANPKSKNSDVRPDKRKNEESKVVNNKKHATRAEMPALNLNLQIHISSDASTEQIESIFAAMRRYLYDNPIS